MYVKSVVATTKFGVRPKFGWLKNSLLIWGNDQCKLWESASGEGVK